jgi:hypothetical protein
MFETALERSRVVRKIRALFKARPAQLNPGKWICVVRRGNLAVVRRSSIGSEDYEVMECFLSPGQIPSWFKTNWAVRKHWPELRPIAQVNLQRCDSERQR